MCDPVSLSIMAVGIAMAATTVVMQNKQRRNNNKLKKLQSELNKETFESQKAGTARKLRGDRQATARTIQEQRMKGAQASAFSQVSASNSGASGLSVDALLSEFSKREGRSVINIQGALKAEEDITGINLETQRLGLASGLVSLTPAKFNPAAAALTIVKGGLSGASQGIGISNALAA